MKSKRVGADKNSGVSQELVRFNNAQVATTTALAPQVSRAYSPLSCLRRHPLVALFAVSAILLPAVVFIRTEVKPTYTVEADISVLPALSRNPGQDAEQKTAFYQYNTLILDEVKNLTKYEVLSGALASLKPHAAKPDAETVQRLQDAIVVARIPETYQIRIALAGFDPAELAATVNAVANTFVAQRRREVLADRRQRLQALATEREKLSRLLDDKAHKKDGLTRELVALEVAVKNAGDAIERLRGDLAQTQNSANQLKANIAQLSWRASLAAGKQQEVAEIGQEMEQLRGQMNAIDIRIQDVTAEANAPGLVRVSGLARAPTHPTKDQAPRYFGFALLAALAAGLLAAVLAEFFNPALDNPEVLESFLGFPLLGWVNELPDVRLAADFAQFRRLAIRLDRAFRDGEAKIFFFTAASAGSGSSFLTTHIGRELARMGHSVIILDANAANPAGAEEVGLLQLLRHELPVDSFLPVVYSDCYRRISLGHATQGETRLPRLINMPGLLAELRLKVDFVLIDGPAVLDSPDSEYLSGVSDATVLVVSADEQKKKTLKKCAELVRAMDLKSVGAVLNRVPSETLLAGTAASREEKPKYENFPVAASG